MSKAVTGAIEITAGAILVATGVGGAFGWSLILSGAGTELAAIADAIQGQRGNLFTVRQAAAPRRVIYGTQRVGAVEVYESTTGGSLDQYNFVLVFAAHEITNFVNLYIDGRQVYWHGSGGAWTVRNGLGFGGGADGNNHTAPDGSTYNFANAISGHRGVFCEARFGDQSTGDYMTSLTANDGRWAPANGNTPSLMGCAYLYCKCEYNTDDFPQKPDFRATIKGKAVYDPRTGVTAYSENWALIVADIITNSTYGLGDAVNQDQLIAAANICDEQVQFYGGGGGYESRYTCHYTWTLDKSVGTVLSDLMQGAAGRMSFIEGEWYLFPGTYYGPTATFTSASLLARPSWTPQRKFRDKCNVINGTYIAPNYPYSVAGDAYDSNGWYNGTLQNNWPFAFTPTSYPTYACDVAHGYVADQFLAEDNGIELPLSLDFASVLSVTQAQRLAKINLLRNRQQGTGTLTFGPEGLVLQPGDTFLFTMPERGWTDKLLEVQRLDFSAPTNEEGAPQLQVMVSVAETDPSVYTWLATDEMTPYEIQAAAVSPNSYQTQPPTSMTLVSSAATAITQPDGTVVPRIQVSWNTPADVRVTGIQIQYQLTGSSTWTDAGTVSAVSTLAFIPATAGAQYDVRIRSVSARGGASVWVEQDGFTAGLVLQIANQTGVGIGSLAYEAYTNGTAAIDCNPFSAQYGSSFVSIFPAGMVQIPNLAQQTLYYVYYDDPTYAGGNVTPVATTNRADTLGVLGRFLIDSIVTGYRGASGSSTRYMPSTFTDSGDSSTSAPGAAYDGNLATAATVYGSASQVHDSHGAPLDPTLVEGICAWSGFDPTVVTSTALTLYVSAGVSIQQIAGAASEADFVMTIAGTATTFATVNATTAQTLYSAVVPSGTQLSDVSLTVDASAGLNGTVNQTNRVRALVYEIYIDT